MNNQSVRSWGYSSATAHVDLAIHHSASAAPSKHSATPGTSRAHSANQSSASPPAGLQSDCPVLVNARSTQSKEFSPATLRVELAIDRHPPSAAPNKDPETQGSSQSHSAGNRDHNVLNYSGDPPSNASVKSKPKRPAPPTSASASASVTSPESSSSPASSSHPQSTSSPPTTVESSIPASQDDIQDAQDEQSAAKKPRIQLSADQPLTSHGKPRERVRTRKVRCDGGKPECFNCSRRTDLSTGPCSYDAAPRRRGKDRTPGSRKLAPYIPKKTRTTRSRLEEEAKRKKLEALERSASYDTSRSVSRQPEYIEGSSSVPIAHSGVPFDFTLDSLLLQPSDFLLAPDLQSASSYGTAYEVAQDQDDNEPTEITTVPSVQFTRETWWDALLTLYAAPLDNPGQIPHMTVALRNSTAERVAADLRFLFKVSIHWYSFLHIPRFFAALFNPARRSAIQPSLVLGLLGLATFNQSSELELGARPREGAPAHRPSARHVQRQRQLGLDRRRPRPSRLGAYIHTVPTYLTPRPRLRSPDARGGSTRGALPSADPRRLRRSTRIPKLSGPRTKEAMAMLDSLIRCLSLTTARRRRPRASVFMPHAVPIVPSDPATSPPPHRAH
ncbi:hypothetical protein NUW54_g12374 [Trametes sanguinea]|uniref:Uncharacterized protein n=1 Tax=Trametes sanguinea TaxID=158606 RepID=A0ACC1MZD0_9APHY|nr:hypothetical protein NUW54_g12374 [Trametes sanguinea]